MNDSVFAQVNTELVRVKAVENARLYALYFSEESGNLENVHLDSGIHELAERHGVEVTVNPMFTARDMYECRIGDVLYTQSVPHQRDGDTTSENVEIAGEMFSVNDSSEADTENVEQEVE